jgi:signal transduction histidine kinase
MVLAPVAAGCYAWWRTPYRRFGLLLIAAGVGWFLTTLSESDDSLVYSIGRMAGWFVELELIYLALTFPTGRLSGRVDRTIVACAVALVCLVYVPTALFDQDFPVPSPWASCGTDCPDNAFFVLNSEPGVIDSVMRPLRDALAALIFLAVTVRLAQRVGGSSRLMRRTLTPVLAVALLRFLTITVFVALRRADPDSAATEIAGWTAALGLPAMAVAFFVGLLRWRLFVGGALQTLGLRMRDGHGADTFQATLGEVLGDPSLEVHWGRSPPEPGAGRRVTRIDDGDRPVAAIVHDETLRDQDELIEAVAGYARIAMDNWRLYTELEASLADVRESRARIVASADRERRRIERDLHDGAQQRLVALRIKLDLAEEALNKDPDDGRARLHALGTEVEATLDEIRALAHGVFPPLLADEGLGEALRAAALRAGVPASVSVDGIGRYPPEVESAVYFCCLEALQNAAKHAGGASRVSVLLSDDGRLRFEVRDDGVGFGADAAPGAGVTNMRDRISAVGGEVELSSAPGGGAAVVGSVPLP